MNKVRNAGRVGLTGLVCAVLAACGGGGGGDVQKSFNQLDLEGQAILATLPTNITPMGDMPTTGSFTYNGVAAISEEPDFDPDTDQADALSAIEVVADFDAPMDQSITGSMTNFRANPSMFMTENLSGSLNIRSDLVPGDGITGSSFVAVAEGRLTGDAGSADFSIDLFGDFYGNNYSHVAGTLDGQAQSVTTPTDPPAPVYGAFVAER